MKLKNRIIMAVTLLCGGSHNLNAQSDMILTPQQQSLAVIACLEAQGETSLLATEIHRAFDNGLSLSQAREALSQLYAYTGFPRSLNALGVLQAVVKEREAAGLSVDAGREADPLPDSYDALTAGTEVQTAVCGGVPFTYAFAPATDYYLKAHLFGDIFARNNLTHAERELVTVAALSGLDKVAPQRLAHIRGALAMGVSEKELRALPALLRERVGDQPALRLEESLATFFQQTDALTALRTEYKAGIADSPYPIGQPNDAYAQYFTGRSYLAPLDAQAGGPVNVTFEPRCRNNWHIHHGQVQVLICVAGRGWYQEEGKAPVELRPGVVVAIPEGVKHWHGAAKDSWMQHLTYHTHVEEGARNEWLEPVSDAHYDALN